MLPKYSPSLRKAASRFFRQADSHDLPASIGFSSDTSVIAEGAGVVSSVL